MARKQGQAAGVNVSASSEADHCLCTVNVTAQDRVPCHASKWMFVLNQSASGSDCGPLWTRVQCVR